MSYLYIIDINPLSVTEDSKFYAVFYHNKVVLILKNKHELIKTPQELINNSAQLQDKDQL